MGSRVAQTVAVILIGCFSNIAWCYDQQVTSDFYAEGYSIPAADGSSISRRNIVEDLHLAAWNLLPGTDHPYYKGPRLSIEMNFRLVGDYGVSHAESNPQSLETYTPGLSPVHLEAVFAYVDARGLWNGAVDLRAGRQIRLDTLGFFAFDGVESIVHMPAGFGVSTFCGYQVQGGTSVGYDALELDGTDDGGVDGLDSEFYPDRSNPPLHLSFGSELSWSPVNWFDSAVGVRIVGLNGEMVEQKFGARFAAGGERFRTDGRVIFNPMFDRKDNRPEAIHEGTYVSAAEASVSVALFHDAWLTAQYDLYRPIFVADSIFNVFDLLPKRDLGLRYEQEIAGRLALAGWGFIRMADGSGGLDGEREDALVSGAGGGVGANYDEKIRRYSTRINIHREWGESRLGLELGGQRGVWGNRIWLGLRGSYWHIEDTVSSDLGGNIVGYVASLRFRIAKMASILGEFENYYGGGRPVRFAMFALLQLDLWR